MGKLRLVAGDHNPLNREFEIEWSCDLLKRIRNFLSELLGGTSPAEPAPAEPAPKRQKTSPSPDIPTEAAAAQTGGAEPAESGGAEPAKSGGAEPAKSGAVEPDVEAEAPKERPSAHEIAIGADFTSFELHPSIRKGLEDAGFQRCTPVQERTLPLSLAGKDVASQAQTGTGKTAAFLITIFQRMMEKGPENLSGCEALILAPTRELAVQIHGDAKLLGKHLPVRSTVIYGGMGYQPQIDALKSGTEIVIATPGRLIDLLKQKYFKPKNVSTLVIDEADRMLDMGFISDLRYIMRRLPPYNKRQSMLFSATLAPRVLELTYEFMNLPEEVVVSPDKLLVDEVEQILYHVGSDEKIPLLLGFLKRGEMERVLIFANTKAQVMRVADRLNANGYKARAITGDFTQSKRESILRQFKEGKVNILAATDVASRGLHVEDISHVVNFDVPQDREEYVHRIGRTARAGKSGKAITLASERDAHNLEPIQEMLGQQIPVSWLEDDMMVPDKGPSRKPSSGERTKRSRPPRPKQKKGEAQPPRPKEKRSEQPAAKSKSTPRRRPRRRKKSPGDKKD
jgi:ATP-dependent RNA helicase RhlB